MKKPAVTSTTGAAVLTRMLERHMLSGMSWNCRPARHSCAIGYRVARVRRAHGYSQARLAKELGLSNQQMWKYEVGETRIAFETMMDIADILDEPLEAFRPSKEIDVHHRRQTKPGQLTDGISMLHDYDAAARSRVRQKQTLPRDADYKHDEVKTRKRERDRERYRQSKPQSNEPTEAEREEACRLPDPFAYLAAG